MQRDSCSPNQRTDLRASVGIACGTAKRVERLADQPGQLADVLRIGRVEVTTLALVAQLQQSVDVSARSADARREPAPHRRMTGRGTAEVAVERMVQHLVFG